MSDLLVITGLSGAGRSEAANELEDLGWFVIDNLPITLLDKVVELGASATGHHQRVALVVGPAADHADLIERITRMKGDEHPVRVVFLDASTNELVKRYGSTRRKHPLDDGAGGLVDAIERERALLDPVKAAADLVVDTTGLSVHQLKARMTEAFGVGAVDSAMRTAVMSFGFKHGLPPDVDLVIDVRFLPNPHWVDDLRPLTGLDEPVRRYVLSQPATAEFLRRFQDLLAMLLPAYAGEGKSYLTVAIGCTGGQHRSVALAEEVAAWMREHGHATRVTHRDLPNLPH